MPDQDRSSEPPQPRPAPMLDAKPATPAPDSKRARRDGNEVARRRAEARGRASAGERVKPLPATMHLGKQPVGSGDWMNVARFIVTDEYVGTGEAHPRVTTIGMRKDQWQLESPVKLGEAGLHPSLRVRFSPALQGRHEAALAIPVLWSDGVQSELSTTLTAVAVAGSRTETSATVDRATAQPHEIEDLPALDHAFDGAHAAQDHAINSRAIGVREAKGNLDKADKPRVSDLIINTLAMAGLGFVTGAVSAEISARLKSMWTVASEEIITTGVQTAIDDALKFALPSITSKIASFGPDRSKEAFFAAQEDGLEISREAQRRALSARRADAVRKLMGLPPEERTQAIHREIQYVRAYEQAHAKMNIKPRALQYQASLVNWMTAMAQGTLGVRHDGGTQLSPAIQGGPEDHYRHKGPAGVVQIALGMRAATRPFGIHGNSQGSVKVMGVTQAALEPIKKIPLRDLKLPIVVTGYLYDGLLDGLSAKMIEDNHISLGRSESGTVFCRGHEDAIAALMKAANTKSPIEAARVILEEDIGDTTLENAHTS